MKYTTPCDPPHPDDVWYADTFVSSNGERFDRAVTSFLRKAQDQGVKITIKSFRPPVHSLDPYAYSRWAASMIRYLHRLGLVKVSRSRQALCQCGSCDYGNAVSAVRYHIAPTS